MATINKLTIWNGLVSYLDDAAGLQQFKATGTVQGYKWPKALRILRGPRSPEWCESAAPCLVVDLIDRKLGDLPAQGHVHRFTLLFQIQLVVVGKTAEEADERALIISNELEDVFLGTGTTFGQKSNFVTGSKFASLGWDPTPRANALVSAMLGNLEVLVGNR